MSARNLARFGHPGQSLFLSALWNAVVSIAYAPFYRVRVQAEAQIPASGPVLILFKHWSLADVPLGKLAITRNNGRHLWCVMKESLARGPFGRLILKVGGIPINRDRPERSRRDLMLARHVLSNGNMLCVFPEQTTVPGRMARGRAPGFRFITAETNQALPVVCIGIHYRPRRFRRTQVDIRIGEALLFQPGDDPEDFLHRAMHKIASLSELQYHFEKSAAPVAS
ncbi:MAG: 1-acyl-sn-glycerol-3-phosphate acyltransferase [Leptospirales bacterium]|nr:1-acyl-sn-glycerol-3-phosphate acyltransferase [Leptospirales bacterium]